MIDEFGEDDDEMGIDPEFGGFDPLGAVVDVTTSVVDKTKDVVSSVVDRIPGNEYLKDAAGVLSGPVKDFVNGPLKDFANTGVGETVMRAVSVSVSMATVAFTPVIAGYTLWWVGPTLAFLAWSIPGLARGDEFDQAMAKEFAYRVAYVISIFSKEAGDEVAKKLSPMLSEQLQKGTQAVLDQIKDQVKLPPYLSGPQINEFLLKQLRADPNSLKMTFQQLAAKLNIREDIAAFALAMMKHENVPDMNNFDPKTGKRKAMPKTAVGKMKINRQVGKPLTKFHMPASIAPSTLAAQTATVEPASQELAAASEAQAGSKSTKKSIWAGLGGTLIGTGGAFLAGLAAPIAIPVGLVLGATAGGVTKLVTRPKKIQGNG